HLTESGNSPLAAIFLTPIQVKKNGKRSAATDPMFPQIVCHDQAWSFCSSFTMSEIIILNGCIDIFEDRSINRMATAPNHSAVEVLKPNEPEFGNRHITMTATIVPKIK